MNFDRLANQHRNAVYAQMVRLCGSHDDAEDALIEALLQANEALPKLRDEAAFRGWLAKIARRVCYRLKDRPELDHLHEMASEVPDAQAQLESEQMRHCLLGAVATLPEKLRSAYQLCDIEQLDDQAAADSLEISLQALRSRLHRARTQLRQLLEHSLCADESFSA